jgi:hypothetical protein
MLLGLDRPQIGRLTGEGGAVDASQGREPSGPVAPVGPGPRWRWRWPASQSSIRQNTVATKIVSFMVDPGAVW